MNALVHVLIGRDEVPAWRSAASRRAAYVASWAGLGLLAAAAITGVVLQSRDHPAGGLLGWLSVELAVCAALPLAPRYPLAAWRLGWLAVLLTPLIPGQSGADPAFYMVAAVGFTVAGLRYGPPRLWWMAAVTLIPVWLWTPPALRGAAAGPPYLGLAPHPDWAYPLRLTAVLAALAAVIYAAGRWRRDRLALAEQRLQARRKGEEAREQAERRAVLEERARIAREMHDVVAHHMSMIAVQAETAPYRVAGLPESAREEFAALSQAAREALTDMRRLLGVLRSEQATERIPQPGLADVPALVEGTRRAGAEVGLTMPRFTGDVAPVVGLTAYRIVQEALSNAARHAPGAAIQVAVEREAGIVRVRIDNDAPGAGLSRGGRGCLPGEPGDGGHGLAGMRERVALLGGQLGAGPQADGGFGVRAELPARLTVECYVADEGHWHAGAS